MENVLRTSLSALLVAVSLFSISTESFAKESQFSRMDTDSDGKMSVEEYSVKSKKPEKAVKRFAKIDTDGNGFISEEEFLARQNKKNKKNKNK